jgi:ferredoxin
MAKFFVDESLCQAQGQCYLRSPKVFGLDEDGYAQDAGKGWIAIEPAYLEEARAAESACPETAIRIIEDTEPDT